MLDITHIITALCSGCTKAIHEQFAVTMEDQRLSIGQFGCALLAASYTYDQDVFRFVRSMLMQFITDYQADLEPVEDNIATMYEITSVAVLIKHLGSQDPESIEARNQELNDSGAELEQLMKDL